MVLVVLLGAAGHAGRTSRPKKPADINTHAVRGRPKLRLVK
jgi:hypothetical protein